MGSWLVSTATHARTPENVQSRAYQEDQKYARLRGPPPGFIEQTFCQESGWTMRGLMPFMWNWQQLLSAMRLLLWRWLQAFGPWDPVRQRPGSVGGNGFSDLHLVWPNGARPLRARRRQQVRAQNQRSRRRIWRNQSQPLNPRHQITHAAPVGTNWFVSNWSPSMSSTRCFIRRSLHFHLPENAAFSHWNCAVNNLDTFRIF